MQVVYIGDKKILGVKILSKLLAVKDTSRDALYTVYSKIMTEAGLEPTTLRSGISRATIAPFGPQKLFVF